MPRQDEIISTIKHVICTEFDVNANGHELGPDTPLFKGGLELDSFAVVELIAQLEAKLSFEFKEADFREEHFRTLGTLGGLIGRYL